MESFTCHGRCLDGTAFAVELPADRRLLTERLVLARPGTAEALADQISTTSASDQRALCHLIHTLMRHLASGVIAGLHHENEVIAARQVVALRAPTAAASAAPTETEHGQDTSMPRTLGTADEEAIDELLEAVEGETESARDRLGL